QLVASALGSPSLSSSVPVIDHPALNRHLTAAACHHLSPRPSFASLQRSPVRRLWRSSSLAAGSSLLPLGTHQSLQCLLPSLAVDRLPISTATSLLSPATSCRLACPSPRLPRVPLCSAPPVKRISLAAHLYLQAHPCIGLTPSAMSQMTAVAMLLPAGGFPSRFGHRGHQHHDTWQRCLVACHHSRGTRAVSNRERFSYSGKRQGEMFGTLRGGRLRPIRPVGHERKPVEVEPGMSTVTCQNATCGPPTHAHGIEVSGHHARAPSMPPHSLPTLAPVNVLYSAITTLIVVLWWKDVTHMQVRAWVHQQGLAGVMKLKSASKCFEPRGIFSFLRSLMKHASFVMQNLGTDVRTVMASLAGTQELSEAMETRMRAVGVQLEETRRELEEAERRRVAEMMEMRGQMEERERELAALKGEFAEQKDALMDLDVDLHIIRSVGDQRTAWE
ncbi:unnamed protein product, partial [Closterium sp. Naga37s-1]